MLLRSDNKVLKFSSGEGNFTAIINGLAENGDVDLTNENPIWDCEVIEVSNVPMSRDNFKLIRANALCYLDLTDRFNQTMDGFVLEIEHDANKKSADIQLLRVNRK
jgi:hypothetical protein